MGISTVGSKDHLLALALRGAKQVGFDWKLPEAILDFTTAVPPELLSFELGKLTHSVPVLQAIAACEQFCELDLRMVEGLSGPWLWAGLCAEVVERDESGAPQRVIGVLSDISTRKMAEQQLRKNAGIRSAMEQALADSGKINSAILQASLDCVISFCEEGKVIDFNPAAESTFGLARREVLGRDFLKTLVAEESHTEYRRNMTLFLETGSSAMLNQRVELQARYRDASGFPAEIAIVPIYLRDKRIFTAYLRNITAQKIAEDRIRHLAHYDELTSLPNRGLFHQILTHAMKTATRAQQKLAVLFVDLDRFKNINDTLGHDAGDLALQEMAQRLRGCLREADTVARMGGDEFYVLIEDLQDGEHAARIARKILAETAKPFSIMDQECQLTASIGIAVYPEDGVDAQTLLKNSDIAMYRSKTGSKNTYQFYSAAKNIHSLGRLALEAQLRRGIENHEFVLHYQPKVNLDSGRITGVEALVRWMHPEQGILAPNYFIPLAEETSLIVPLGKMILRKACEDALFINAGMAHPIRVAVNLSARQFDDSEFLADLRRILGESGCSTDFLQLEITESMVMNHPEQAVRTMLELQEMGIRLDIDDFGTGYSSLTYLKRFPVYSLKIDRSFIQDLHTEKNDVAITKAIIAMGHSMGLRIVAEGVEAVEQMDALREYGCDEFQGFYFSRPVPLEEFVALQRTQAALH